MKFKTFMGGEGYMRKDDHQFFQDMYIANFGPTPGGREIRRGKDRLGLEDAGRREGQGHRASDDLQDGSSVLIA